MTHKPKNTDVARAMIDLIGTPYRTMDCQAAIEAAVHVCGGEMDYTGSNAMARDVLYLIPIEQAIKQGLQPGDALFIHAADGGEPEKYKRDGLGNFNHVAMYVGENALADVDREGKLRACNAVHSSQTMGRVAGTTVKNGYTHAGRFDQIGYGGAGIPATEDDSDTESVTTTPEPPKPYSPATPSPGWAIINTKDTGLLLRKTPDEKKGNIIKEMPKGAVVKVLQQWSGWTKVLFVNYDDMPHEGYCKTEYLLFG